VVFTFFSRRKALAKSHVARSFVVFGTGVWAL
jgi:hypothetical protein